jgi:hypothetical protein
MIAAEDMLHIRGFSLNGLAGMSRISLAREAIALGLAQEQQAARWMGQGAKPSGMLTTDQKLSEGAAKRLAEDFKQNVAGLQNSGKIIVGEQGLKFMPYSMTSSDLEFIASRDFQMKDVARIFRIPPHMLGEMTQGHQQFIAQMAQEYINFTLTGYTNRWRAKMSSTFGLRKDNLSVEFDYRDLTTADMTSRINNLAHRHHVDDGEARRGPRRSRHARQRRGADKLHFPQTWRRPAASRPAMRRKMPAVRKAHRRAFNEASCISREAGPEIEARYQRAGQWLLAAIYHNEKARAWCKAERRAARQGRGRNHRFERRVPGAHRSGERHPRYSRQLRRVPPPRAHRADGVRQHERCPARPAAPALRLSERARGVGRYRHQRRPDQPDGQEDRLADSAIERARGRRHRRHGRLRRE